MKKDTERVDEIRALKKAWEAAEPGRAAKVGIQTTLYLGNKSADSGCHVIIPAFQGGFLFCRIEAKISFLSLKHLYWQSN